MRPGIVQHDPAAIRMLGEPIQQKGLHRRIDVDQQRQAHRGPYVTVAAPLAKRPSKRTASLAFESHLDVRLGRNGRAKRSTPGRSTARRFTKGSPSDRVAVYDTKIEGSSALVDVDASFDDSDERRSTRERLTYGHRLSTRR